MLKFCKAFLITSILFISGQAWAGRVSLEPNFVAGESDLVGHLNRDRTGLTNGINNIRGATAGTAQSSGQIEAATIAEENMADNANPRIRTNEGAACEFVLSGLLPVTSTNLVGSVPSGTAYPRGFRIVKSSATAKTFTASKWTYVDLDQNGSFTFPEQTIGGSAPAVSSNSIRLARVSTDPTTIFSVTDLRKLSCATGPLSSIADVAGEASLNDLLSNGAWVRKTSQTGRTPKGLATGMFVSWDTATTFLVTNGSGYINGKYRSVSTDTTVTKNADDPINGTSGIDTGSVAASTRYFVYAVADQEAVKTYSISYSTSASAPTGVTNSRLIGSIMTDATSLFTSRDTSTAHGVFERELIGGFVIFEGNAGAVKIQNAYNVSSISEAATGEYTINWDLDYVSSDSYAIGANGGGGELFNSRIIIKSIAAGSITIESTNTANSKVTTAIVTVLSAGDTRK